MIVSYYVEPGFPDNLVRIKHYLICYSASPRRTCSALNFPLFCLPCFLLYFIFVPFELLMCVLRQCSSACRRPRKQPYCLLNPPPPWHFYHLVYAPVQPFNLLHTLRSIALKFKWHALAKHFNQRSRHAAHLSGEKEKKGWGSGTAGQHSPWQQ